ncbi:MAG: hypothetical protein ACP5U1_14635 [Desulfomonilaceae bacterium]
MSKIGDSFPLKIKRQFVRNRLQRGLVIKVEIPEQDYEKFFVFMGYDPETKEAYGFFINTPKKNPVLSRKNLVVRDFQVRVQQSGHTFLKYDSDVNCFSYYGMDFYEMVNSLIESPIKICGDLQAETLAKMEEAVETNRTFSNYEKKILIGPLSIPMF